jgi:hypothetical protein
VLPASVLRRLTDYEFSGAALRSAGEGAKPDTSEGMLAENARAASAATSG